MQTEQLTLELINNNENLQDLEQVESEVDNVENLLYKNKLRKIIDDISIYEGIPGVRLSSEGYERIQENSKYIISILVFEIIEELKRTGRKTITLDDADVALDKILNKVSSIDYTIAMLKENINKFDSLFVCNPNNPNGKVKNLEKLLDIIVDNNKLLIVDETFMEFVEEEEKYSLVKYVEKYPNLFILKAVTKFFGLPGIRLGYGLTSNNDIIEKIYNYKEPWTINSFADTLSNYIFKDQKYIEDSKEYYIDERNFMLSELKSINSIHVYDTDTNFILIRLNDKRAKEIKVELLREGNILIRDASNFIGLDDRYIRIAIKSHKENELLIRHMKKLLGD